MSLSQQETTFLTHFSASGKKLINFDEAEEYFRSRIAAVNTLGRLARKGWLQRLERGLYLIIPLEAGPERTWSENSFLIASQLSSPGAIAYWSALRYWNWTEQIPQVVFIQTTHRKRAVVIQSTPYYFISVSPKHFFGITTQTVDGMLISITEPEKTLIDASARPDLCGGIVQLAQVLQNNQQSIDWEKLTKYLIHWGGGSVAKRLGYLGEKLVLKIPENLLTDWKNLISKGISPLEPGSASKGEIVTRWNIQNNINF
ncbi:MAG: type IV toxin-antitoxin system AbiEi family antitoxin domain-containing protein [Chloroflexota bacterium]